MIAEKKTGRRSVLRRVVKKERRRKGMEVGCYM